MKMSEAFPSNYLSAVDLQGRPVTVIMGAVEREPIGNNKDIKPVLYFQGKNKGMVLNKTNSNSIVMMYGDDSEFWAGKTITIYPAKTDFRGDIVDCLRIQSPNAQPIYQSASQVQPDPNAPVAAASQVATAPTNGGNIDDEIPF